MIAELKRKLSRLKWVLHALDFIRNVKNQKKSFDASEVAMLADILGVDPGKVLEAILIS